MFFCLEGHLLSPWKLFVKGITSLIVIVAKYFMELWFDYWLFVMICVERIDLGFSFRRGNGKLYRL